MTRIPSSTHSVGMNLARTFQGRGRQHGLLVATRRKHPIHLSRRRNAGLKLVPTLRVEIYSAVAAVPAAHGKVSCFGRKELIITRREPCNHPIAVLPLMCSNVFRLSCETP